MPKLDRVFDGVSSLRIERDAKGYILIADGRVQALPGVSHFEFRLGEECRLSSMHFGSDPAFDAVQLSLTFGQRASIRVSAPDARCLIEKRAA